MKAEQKAKEKAEKEKNKPAVERSNDKKEAQQNEEVTDPNVTSISLHSLKVFHKDGLRIGRRSKVMEMS